MKSSKHYFFGLLCLLFSVACSRKAEFFPTSESLKSDKHYKRYFEVVESMTQTLNDKNVNNKIMVVQKLRDIKRISDKNDRNAAYINHTKELVNKDNVSYQTLFKTAQYHYSKLLFKYVVKGKMSKEQFNLTFRNEIKERASQSKKEIELKIQQLKTMQNR